MNDSTFKQYIPMDGTRNLVGSAEGYTAMSVLQFYPNYFPLSRYGECAVRDDEVAPLLPAWRSSRTTSRSMCIVSRGPGAPQRITWDSVQTGFYDASTKRGTFSDNVSSDTGFIYVDLDTAMVRQWLSSTATSDHQVRDHSCPDAVRVGARLRAVSAGAIRQHTSHAARSSPQTRAGTTRDTSMYSQTFGTFVGDVTLPHTPDIMNVQAGVVYRSKLLVRRLFYPPRHDDQQRGTLRLTWSRRSTRLTSFTTDTNVAGHLGFSDDPSVH